MAGLLGMAVLSGTKTVTCPHCGKRQVRDRHASRVACKRCRRVFAAIATPSKSTKKR